MARGTQKGVVAGNFVSAPRVEAEFWGGLGHVLLGTT
jgi:hypothetical protein